MTAKATRKDRFRRLRDEVLRHTDKMRPSATHRGGEMIVGGFHVSYAAPGEWGSLRGFHIDIWPPATPEDRAASVLFGNKVCSADWSQDGTIEIITFKSGPWEADLLSLLCGRQNVSEIDCTAAAE